MKKSLSIIPAIVLALSLTACNTSPETGENSSDTSSGVSEPVSGGNSSESSNSESSTTSDTPTPVGNEITAQFEVPNGEPVDLTNAVVTGYEGEIPFSEMTNNNWAQVTCDYVYLAEPLGIYYDSVKNADIFNENEMTFTGAPETVSYKFKKYKVGESFGELKVTDARTSFFPEWFDSKPKYFNGGSVRFEGALTLTGKCFISPEDDMYVSKRDIKFFPDADSRKLPVMEYRSDENGNSTLHTSMNNTVCWLSEYPTGIALGNADSYPDFDFGEFPEDGSLVDVQVTIDNVFFRNELNFTKSFSAKLVDIKLI